MDTTAGYEPHENCNGRQLFCGQSSCNGLQLSVKSYACPFTRPWKSEVYTSTINDHGDADSLVHTNTENEKLDTSPRKTL